MPAAGFVPGTLIRASYTRPSISARIMSKYALGVQPVARALMFVPPTGQVWRSYYYAGGQRIAMRVEGAPSNNGVFYLLTDHLGSTSVTADATGNPVSVLRYYPYGQTRYSSGVTPTTYRYTGQRSDESSTGLYFYGARYYDALIGRFISADTIVPGAGNPQALNRYAYSLSNPLKYTDPSGHCGGIPGFIAGILGFFGISYSCPSPIDFGTEGFDPAPLDVGQEGYTPAPVDDWIEGFDPAPVDDWTEGFSPAPADDWIEGYDPAPSGQTVYASESGDDEDSGSTLRPGPFAGGSIPARGPERDWKDEEIEAIDLLGQTYGCHTCGTKDPGTGGGHFVLDHQLPTKINFGNEPQRLYPHCINCSRRQGGEVTEYLRRLRFNDEVEGT